MQLYTLFRLARSIEVGRSTLGLSHMPDFFNCFHEFLCLNLSTSRNLSGVLTPWITYIQTCLLAFLTESALILAKAQVQRQGRGFFVPL